MKKTSRSNHRCGSCASYTEVVYVPDNKLVELHICPVCLGASILQHVEVPS